MRWLLACLLSLLMTSPTVQAAEESSLITEVPKPTNYELYNPIALNWNCRPATYTSFLSQVTNPTLPVGSFGIKYDGLDEIAIEQLQKKARSFCRDQLQRHFTEGDLSYEAYQSKLALLDVRTDIIGNWWERRWFESLPSEKGGAPEVPVYQTVGSRHKMVNVGRFSMDNTGHFLYRGVDVVTVDSDTRVVPRNINAQLMEPTPTRKNLDLLFGQMLHNDSIKFNCKPIVKLRFDRWPTVLEAALKFEMELCHNKRPYATLDCTLFYDSNNDHEVGFALTAQLINW